MNTLPPLLQNRVGERRLEADRGAVLLIAEKAASPALFVSQRVSHAGKQGRGEVEIVLRNKTETWRLEICDDSDGFPADFNLHTAVNTGLPLIENAAIWNLRGEIRHDNHDKGGGRVTVIFPLA